MGAMRAHGGPVKQKPQRPIFWATSMTDNAWRVRLCGGPADGDVLSGHVTECPWYWNCANREFYCSFMHGPVAYLYHVPKYSVAQVHKELQKCL